jgi:Protein of unknown function (DUF3007)
MRRIDAILITLGVFVAGGLAYLLLKVVGLEGVQAGIWSQVALVLGLLGWVSTYIYRAMNQKMSYVQQLRDYEEAVIQKRFEEMTPEQLAEFQAELDRDRQAKPEES